MQQIDRRTFAFLVAAPLLWAGPLAGMAAAAPGSFSLDSYRGRVVYLDFWASWCGPCKLSFPFMAGLLRRYPPDDLAVVTINVDRSRQAAERFLAEAGGGLPVVYDDSGAIAKSYHVAEMPTSMLFDRQGRLRFTHKGFHPEQTATYGAHVDALVNAR
jgi:thiol-disulfide isomerase/thioredoxin